MTTVLHMSFFGKLRWCMPCGFARQPIRRIASEISRDMDIHYLYTSHTTWPIATLDEFRGASQMARAKLVMLCTFTRAEKSPWTGKHAQNLSLSNSVQRALARGAAISKSPMSWQDNPEAQWLHCLNAFVHHRDGSDPHRLHMVKCLSFSTCLLFDQHGKACIY